MENKLTVTINKTELPIKEYQGQRVVTMKEIDAVHQRPEGTADRNFRANEKRFIEGTDFFRVSKSQSDEIRGLEIPNRGLTLITESGYLMLVKSFTDDLAWAVQRQLVNVYFRAMPEQRKKAAQQSKLQIDPTKKALAEAKLNNSRARVASMWMRVSDAVPIPEYKQLCASYASEALAGKPVLPFPKVEERTYTAEEVGGMLGGISSNKVGRIANQYGLKVPEYAVKVWDKSRYSSKQVPAWRYNDRAVERFCKILGLPEQEHGT